MFLVLQKSRKFQVLVQLKTCVKSLPHLEFCEILHIFFESVLLVLIQCQNISWLKGKYILI